MNDDESKTPAPKANPDTKAIPGDRIAKVLARAGVASRREAEKIIEAGRVTVNGKTILTPALNVTDKDRIVVDGKPLAEPEPPRIWLYYKPIGLVTSERDEKGRETVFDTLPDDMPRVVSVGRLDINSEGLLLLTNDGELKRKMELPSTGWLRRYRVRINGSLSEAKLDELRAGIQIDGVHYAPVEVKFDRQQGANAWLTMGLREGKNREIRKLMEAMGVVVNRLLRISYGPFQLGTLRPGKVEEVKQRIVRDQMGLRETPKPTMVGKAAEKGKRPPPKRGTAASAKRFTDPEKRNSDPTKRNSGAVKRNSGPTSGHSAGRSAGKPPRK